MSNAAYIQREVTEHVYNMCKWFPVVSVTGPRQSGKSTLLRQLFPDFTYVNLENVEQRDEAVNDPVGFINSRPRNLIIDEAQYAPDLFSMVQVRVDESNEKGQYILSGSQNFLLLRNIKQSLAGRVGLIKLLPFSYRELYAEDNEIDIDDLIFNGGYPGIYSTGIPKDALLENYIETYVMRDITEFLNTGNLSTFRKFLKICAEQSSNLLNLTNIANHIDISRTTCKQWISYLESSYVAFRLFPYYNNKIRTLTKSPKLYFYDTGLLTYLLGIKNKEELLTSPHLGQVFENFVISETIKNYQNQLVRPDLYFYRDDSKLEADMLDLTDKTHISLSEIKSGQTYQHKFMKQLKTISSKMPMAIENKQVIMRVNNSYNADDSRVTAIRDYLTQ